MQYMSKHYYIQPYHICTNFVHKPVQTNHHCENEITCCDCEAFGLFSFFVFVLVLENERKHFRLNFFPCFHMSVVCETCDGRANSRVSSSGFQTPAAATGNKLKKATSLCQKQHCLGVPNIKWGQPSLVQTWIRWTG